MEKRPFIDQFNDARRAAVPLVAVCTPDIEATMQVIALNQYNKDATLLCHDCVRGVTGVNPVGQAFLHAIPKEKRDAWINPVTLMDDAAKNDANGKPLFKPKTILFMCNLQSFMNDSGVVQAIWNLRPVFKQNSRMLCMLGPDFRLPPEIEGDVIVLNEPLPDKEQLEAIVREIYKQVDVPVPTSEKLEQSVAALSGLSAFSAEQVCAMSIRKSGIDNHHLWERKRQAIERTPGLSVWRGGQTFDDIGGCDNIKKFLRRIINGIDRPWAIVFQDEIEKQFGGATGDMSGVTQELLGKQLTFMQDTSATGLLFLGHAGVAKSEIAKAAGNEAGIPTIQLNLGDTKAGIVGASNSNMRNVLKVTEAVSQGRALWIATSNDIEGLPPELRRRFAFGTFFFDLPTPAERRVIWDIYFKKFELQAQDLPPDSGWTGAEIKNCCMLAHRLQIPLIEAKEYIVPISTSARERIVKLRRAASQRYISASYPGVYRKPEGDDAEFADELVIVAATMPASSGRAVDLAESEPQQPKKKSGGKNVN